MILIGSFRCRACLAPAMQATAGQAPEVQGPSVWSSRLLAYLAASRPAAWVFARWPARLWEKRSFPAYLGSLARSGLLHLTSQAYCWVQGANHQAFASLCCNHASDNCLNKQITEYKAWHRLTYIWSSCCSAATRCITELHFNWIMLTIKRI